MYVRRVSLVVGLLMSMSAHAKVFKLTNSQTGQTMEVHCIFQNSVQCQTKLEEAKKRLIQNTNPQKTTLSGARAEDTFNNVRDGVSETGEGIAEMGRDLRDGASSVASDLADKLRQGAGHVADGSSSALNLVGDKINQGADMAADGASNIADKVTNGFNSGVAFAKGKTYRVRVPGNEHSMTFHCRGGLESKECLEEKAAVVEAIRSGSKADSLADHRLQPVYNVGNSARDLAVGATNLVTDSFDKLGHETCQTKLERHARNFDESYRSKFQSGEQTELVSYMEKMDYIKERLIIESKFEACEEHFDNATLGYQLEWISGNRVARRETHIFDGLGKIKEGMGYWKNEERSSSHLGEGSSR